MLTRRSDEAVEYLVADLVEDLIDAYMTIQCSVQAADEMLPFLRAL